MTDRVARLDLEPIKERLKDWGYPRRADCLDLVAEVERLRSALLPPSDLVPRIDRELAERFSVREMNPVFLIPRVRELLKDVRSTLLLCEAQGRRHEEEPETKNDEKSLTRMDTKAGADR